MKKILVMGGNQFLGKAIVRKLLKLEHQVFVINRGTRENLCGTIHLKCDRNNQTDLENITKNLFFDIVIDISGYLPEQIKILQEALKDRYSQYIYISSASIYNNNFSFPIKESSEVGSNEVWGSYAENKYLSERVIIDGEAKKKYKYTIFRPFYIYGPENNLNRESFLFSRIINNYPIFIPNSGNEIIQFGYIDDLVNAIIYSFKNEYFYNEIFNISGEEAITIKKYVEICGKVVLKEPKIYSVNLEREKLKAKDWFPFRDVHLFGNMEKIKKTGFKIEKGLEEGLKISYEYLVKNGGIENPVFNEVEKNLQWKNMRNLSDNLGVE